MLKCPNFGPKKWDLEQFLYDYTETLTKNLDFLSFGKVNAH